MIKITRLVSAIPLATVERIMREEGAEKVSDGAKRALESTLEKYAREVSKLAVKLAYHAGRRTIKAEDIELAVDE